MARAKLGLRFIPVVVIGIMLLSASVPAHATNYPMGQITSTSSAVTGPFGTTYTMGWRFQVTGASVQVTHLCCYVGSLTSCDIKLWNDNASSPTMLAQATPTGLFRPVISMNAGSF